MLTECLFLSLLVVSHAGYLLLARRLTRLPALTLPFVVLCAEGLIVFLGGLLRVMNVLSCALLGGGVLALGFCVWKREREAVRPASVAAAVAMLLALAWAAYRLYGERLVICDNFSHWAAVIKLC